MMDDEPVRGLFCDHPDCTGAYWHVCWSCDGSGYETSDDEFDDSYASCSTCGGAGGWPCPGGALQQAIP